MPRKEYDDYDLPEPGTIEAVGELTISSFDIPGSEHFVGRVSIRYKEGKKPDPDIAGYTSNTYEEYLWYHLTSKEVKRLNLKERDWSEVTYEVGDACTRFWHRDDVIEEAKRFAQMIPDLKLLVGSIRNPGLVVWGEDEELVKQLQPLAEQAEAWYDETDDPWSRFGYAKVEKVWDKWYSLIQPLLSRDG